MFEKFFLLKPVLTAISGGKIFTVLFSWFLKILSGILAVGALYGSWLLWSNLSKITGGMGGESSFKFFLGAAFAEILILALVFIVINILLIRSEDIEKLPLAKYYPVTPIIVIFIKMMGEIFASTYAFISLAFALVSWTVGGSVLSMLPFPHLPGLSTSGGGSLTSGLITIAQGSIIGFLLLVFAYFAAEATGALVDIARNTKK